MGNLMDVRRKIALNTPHIETAISSGITAFKTDMRASLKACKIGISVIQSGSGDPSPTNVRPLTGHTGVTLTHSGVNVLQSDTFSNGTTTKGVTFTGTRNSDGELVSVSVTGTGTGNNIFKNLNHKDNKFKWPPNGAYASYTYTQGVDLLPASNSGIMKDIYGADGQRNTYIDARWRYWDIEHNDSNGAEWFRLQTVPNNSTDVSFNTIAYPMVCLFEDAGCEYEPYKGQSYTVDWSSTAGTIYGGYIDLVSGELVVTHGHIKCVGNEDWFISSAITNYCAYRPTLLGILPKVTESVYVTPISDKLKGIGQYATGLYQVTINNGGNLYFGAPEELSTKEAVNSWIQEIGGIDIVYELRSPIVYQLTPIQIKTFVGRNNIWSTGNDEVEVKYWVHKPYDIGIPIEYKQCDYIQTTGGKARFDTGVPGNDTTLQIAGDVKEMTFGAYNAFIGNHVNDSSLCWRILAPSANTNNTILFNTYRDTTTGLSIPSGTWQNLPFRFKFLIRQNFAQIIIGNTMTNYTWAAETTKPTNNTNIAVGSRNPTGESGTAIHRIYSVRIWSHDELIRDYKPCIRRSDNVAGFYDMVNRTFNPSTGSTQFIAGND